MKNVEERPLYPYAQRVQKLRKDAGMTQDDLAYEIGVSAKTIGNIETARNGPGIDVLLNLSLFFGVSPYYLYFGGDGEMNKYSNTIVSELTSIDDLQIINEIHEMKLDNTMLSQLMMSEELIQKVWESWKKFDVSKNDSTAKRQMYKNYVLETIIRYCANRIKIKKKYNL